MSKLERLLNLTALLLETTRALTIDEIGRSIPGYPDDPASFRRAFERDKDDMRELGIPLRLVQLSPTDATHIGYTIDPSDYYLRDPGLDPDELAALWFAAGAVRLDDAAVEATFRKLGGVPTTDGGGSDGIEIGDVSAAPHLDAVFRGIVERRRLTFDYRGETRRVEPHHLGFTRSRWYVTGRDLDRDGTRVFRLDRIDNTPTLGGADAFGAPAEKVSLRIEPWRYGDGEAVTARVEIDAERLADLLRQVGAERLVSPPGEEPAVVEFEVRDRAAFRHLILGYGASARVTAPAELVDLIVDWLEAAAR